MPNWCGNTLEISSSNAETIATFKEQARAEWTDLSLENFLPTPGPLLDTSHCTPPGDPRKRQEFDRVRATNLFEYGSADWYDWNIEHWGTKWDVVAKLVESRQHCLAYAFDSAWSPPLAWLRHVSAHFADACFFLSFAEPDMGLAGTAVAVAGNVDAHPVKLDMDWGEDAEDGEGDAVAEW